MSNFYADVIQNDSRFRSVSRIDDLQLLHPTFRRKVQAILDDAAGHGRPMVVIETYRSQTRQEQLFQQGATQLRHVGLHHYGLAADFAYLVGGEPSWKPSFDFLGHLAKSHNLIWGGDWGAPQIHHSFIDDDHVQLIKVAQQNSIFNGSWYPDDSWELPV